MTASNSSEVMIQTVPQVPETLLTGSALERSRPRRIQRGDAGHRPIALLPRFGRRIQHVQLHRVVGDRVGCIRGQFGLALVLVLLDRGLPRESPSGISSTAKTSPACGWSQPTVSTVNTRVLPGISLRQSPTFTSVAVTVPLPIEQQKMMAATASSTQSPDRTSPAIATTAPPWPCLAVFSPTMPQTTLIRTPPRTPKISETIAHQLVCALAAARSSPVAALIGHGGGGGGDRDRAGWPYGPGGGGWPYGGGLLGGVVTR